jgi:tRNA nucleotidyltransferase/poly(A) polymerase
MDFTKLKKLAFTYADISTETDDLMGQLWGEAPTSKEEPAAQPANPTANPTAQSPKPKPQSATKRTGFEIPGYQRVTTTPDKALQQKAYSILTKIRQNPLGTKVPFQHAGIDYLAVLEEHPPSPRNPNYHPGISLFYKPSASPALQMMQGQVPSPLLQISERSQRMLQGLDPVFRPKAEELLRKGLAAGLKPEIVEGKRSQERQDELYEQGRTKPGKVVTWTKSSAHTKGLAVDIAQLDDKGNITYNASPGFWDQMGQIGKSLGLMWGGDWKKNKDRPHFQWKPPAKQASPGNVLNDMLRKFAEATRQLMDIKPTAREKKIFDLLRDVVRTKAPDTTLRVAGGWVRDKLMGKGSNDIDISPDNMSGEEFANLVKEYLEERGVSGGTVAVVNANPEQSKHLATAMIRLFGQPIDFVQLRTETYADSRIPTAEAGTPEEDASRRDLTINSMFYNINTGEVEDYMGGLEDLRNGIARTPIDPVQTFLDDPLRILRTVRFAARYDLELDPELIAAAKRPEVQDAFRNKVSKERIWQELAWKPEGKKAKPAALTGPDPTRAARLLGQLGFRDIVFEILPEDVEQLRGEFGEGEIIPFESEQQNPHHDLDIWGHTLKGLEEAVKLIRSSEEPGVEEQAVAYLTMILHDIGKRYTGIHGVHEEGHRTYHDHARVSADLARNILQRLKAPKEVINRVSNLILLHMRLHETAGYLGPKALRKIIGKIGPDYKILVQLSEADALGKTEVSEEQREELQERYRGYVPRFEAAQESMGGGTKPQRPISGNDLKELGVEQGPKMGEIFRALDEELLQNPAMTREEALELARNMLS